jgi:hypothetical protein
MDYIKATFSLLVTTLYFMFSMQWKADFCFKDNSNKRNHFNVVLLSIDHYNRKHDVVAWFSLLQKENNQMVKVFFFIGN